MFAGRPSKKNKLRRRLRPSIPDTSTTTGSINGNGCVRLIVKSPIPPPYTWTDTDELAFAAVSIFDEDYYQQPPPQITPKSQAPIVDSDEDHLSPIGGGGSIVDDDYLWSAIFLRLPSSRLVWTDQDEDYLSPIGAGGQGIDEDYLWAAQYLALLANKPPLTDTDELAFTVQIGLEDDLWPPTPTQFLPSSRLVVSTSDEDFLLPIGSGGMGVEEELWNPQRNYQIRNIQPFTDDETFFVIATPFFLDEFFWIQDGRIAITRNQPVFTSDEDVWPTPPVVGTNPASLLNALLYGWARADINSKGETS